MENNTAISAFVRSGNVVLNNYLLEHYQDIGMNNDQFLVYVQLRKFLEQGEKLPDLTMVAKNMRLTKNSVANTLQSMIKQGFAEMKSVSNEFGQSVDQLNFDGLYNQLLELTPIIDKSQTKSKKLETSSRQQVFAAIESEFQRPLSTFELQTVSKWFDEAKYDPEMIMLALKEAVLNNVYNFRYIEQILVNWRQNNIQTELDVSQNRIKRQQKMNIKTNKKETKIRNIPYIDIMNLNE